MNSFVRSRPALLTLLQVDDVPYHKTMGERCAWVRDWMFGKWPNLCFDARQINRGRCFIFAYVVAALTPHDVDFYTSHGHVVVFDPQTGKYHDSEHIRGCKQRSRLDLHAYDGFKAMVDRQVMSVLWGNRGVQHHEFREIVKKLEPSNALNECWDVDVTWELEHAIDFVKKNAS